MIEFQNFFTIISLSYVFMSGLSMLESPTTTQQRRLGEGTSQSTGCSSPKLLVISLDGFRYDYYDSVFLKSLQSFAARGVHAKQGMTAVFPTVTLASHYTIATGLYQESHGIVSNKFYDPISNMTFGKQSHESHFFGGEPIWVTAKKQGKRTAVYNWVGGETDWGSNVPDIAPPFSDDVSLHERIDHVIKNLSEDKLELIMLYYFQPDRASHEYGALSPAVVHELRVIDQELELMFRIMDEKGLTDNVNIIILADHGVMNLTADPLILIQSDHPVLLNHTDRVIPGDVVAHFFPKSGADHEEQTISYLTDLMRTRGNFKVYTKSEIPDRWHYRNNPRIAPVIVVADPGYIIMMHNASEVSYNQKIDKGNHGYDNEESQMRPLFMAAGPDFKRNYSFSHVFDSTNIYSLLSHLLRIRAAPTNGSFQEVSHLMRRKVSLSCRAQESNLFNFA